MLKIQAALIRLTDTYFFCHKLSCTLTSIVLYTHHCAYQCDWYLLLIQLIDKYIYFSLRICLIEEVRQMSTISNCKQQSKNHFDMLVYWKIIGVLFFLTIKPLGSFRGTFFSLCWKVCWCHIFLSFFKLYKIPKFDTFSGRVSECVWLLGTPSPIIDKQLWGTKFLVINHSKHH